MKKVLTILAMSVLIFSTFVGFSNEKAEATTCSVDIVPNKNSFSAAESNLTFYLTKSSGCGTESYRVILEYLDNYEAHPTVHSGTFSYQTPTKSFNLNLVSRQFDRTARIYAYVGDSTYPSAVEQIQVYKNSGPYSLNEE